MDRINSFWILLLVAFLGSQQEVRAAPSLKIETSSPTVALGGSISIKCTIVDYETGYFIYWRKKQGSDPAVLIGTNNLIESRFEETGRYTLIAPQNQGGDLEFVLNVEDAHAEDWGDYGCEVPIGSTQSAYTSVTVPTPVQAVKLFVRSALLGDPFKEYGHGAKINFTEGAGYNFKCSASGSNPAPSYQMLIAGEDVTEYFEPVSGSGSSTVDNSLLEGLRTVSYGNAIQTKNPINITHPSNTLQLWCYGSTEGTTPVGSYVEAKMFYAPDHQDDCVVVVRAGRYQTNVVLKCTIRSDPVIQNATVSWNENGIPVTLKDGEKHSHYTMSLVQGATDDSRVMQLDIDRAFPQVFRQYTFKAFSSHGEIVHQTTLERDRSLESTQAAGTIRACSLLIGCIMLLCSL